MAARGDRREVRTEQAPAPVGPYSQAIVHDGLVYASGQIPLDPATGKLVEGGIEAQTEQVFANLAAVLAAAGASMDDVLRAGIYLTDLSDFPKVNDIYARRFTQDPKPARSTIGVAALPLGAQVEVDCVARIPGS
jgi:2-iminobutanoate/2-iminopropanoate deaminase